MIMLVQDEINYKDSIALKAPRTKRKTMAIAESARTAFRTRLSVGKDMIGYVFVGAVGGFSYRKQS